MAKGRGNEWKETCALIELTVTHLLAADKRATTALCSLSLSLEKHKEYSALLRTTEDNDDDDEQKKKHNFI